MHPSNLRENLKRKKKATFNSSVRHRCRRRRGDRRRMEPRCRTGTGGLRQSSCIGTTRSRRWESPFRSTPRREGWCKVVACTLRHRSKSLCTCTIDGKTRRLGSASSQCNLGNRSSMDCRRSNRMPGLGRRRRRRRKTGCLFGMYLYSNVQYEIYGFLDFLIFWEGRKRKWRWLAYGLAFGSVQLFSDHGRSFASHEASDCCSCDCDCCHIVWLAWQGGQEEDKKWQKVIYSC